MKKHVAIAIVIFFAVWTFQAFNAVVYGTGPSPYESTSYLLGYHFGRIAISALIAFGYFRFATRHTRRAARDASAAEAVPTPRGDVAGNR